MAEEGTTKRRRARRPSEVAARLERLRQRNAEQLAAQREAERQIETALTAYVDTDVSIHAVERERDETLAALERQAEQVREAALEKAEQIRVQQAIAVWQLNAAGRTVEQIAELLEVSQKETRQLLATGRTATQSDPVAAPDKASTPAGNADPAEQPAQQVSPMPAGATSEQRDLHGVDGHQDGANAILVPAVPDHSGERT